MTMIIIIPVKAPITPYSTSSEMQKTLYKSKGIPLITRDTNKGVNLQSESVPSDQTKRLS